MATTPGFGTRLCIAFAAFFRSLTQPLFAGQVDGLLSGQAISSVPVPVTPSLPVEPAKPQLSPLQLLAILQREGRLVDFLMEDIQGLPDAQIGAAVREVHKKTAKALRDHVVVEPVVATQEDETMTVDAGYDPSAIRVVGNLGANPPYSGTVRHRGWQVKELKMQPLPSGQNVNIIAPAEVEVP
ncbi:MAG: DUF2760 domain-containing protein [Gemmatales bacterium]